MDKAVFSPRANVRYNPTADVNLRLSYAEGFRAPQAFDEDLHISNVGGARVSIVRDPNLKEERSRSVNGSVDWYHYFGDFQVNMLLEGRWCRLAATVRGQRCTVLRWRERLSGGIKYRYRQV